MSGPLLKEKALKAAQNLQVYNWIQSFQWLVGNILSGTYNFFLKPCVVDLHNMENCKVLNIGSLNCEILKDYAPERSFFRASHQNIYIKKW